MKCTGGFLRSGPQLLGLLSWAAVSLHGQRAPLFSSEIQPVFERSCVKCHGPAQKMAGLDLSSFAGVMAGGSGGRAIIPGRPDRSLLWQMIDQGKMPLNGTISPGDKQLIRTYIEQGRFPAGDAVAASRQSARITAQARNWWAFQKPVNPTVPQNGEANPIDAFIVAKLAERRWELGPQADRLTLIRRASLDLLGLPPSPGEVKAFLDDASPNGYERLLDRLLASPHYGERYGRHWLDVAGYSDSIGDASDREREAAWKYRDYVIRAFNNNKPFDRFLVEQLAGDQLVNYDPSTRPTAAQVEAVTATGFTRMTADITDNQTIYQVDKYFDALQKSTETSLKAVLGLTIGCARCHDHKFDPILQHDYYKLTAVFQAAFDPENWLVSNLSYGPWPSRMVLDIDSEKRHAWIESVASEAAKKLRRDRQELAATYRAYREATVEGKELTSELRESIARQIAAATDLEPDPNLPDPGPSDAMLDARFPELASRRADIKSRRERDSGARIDPNYIMALWDVSKTPSPTYLLQRGSYLAPGEAVEPGILAVLDDPARPFVFPDPKQHPEWHHTGRRLTLARWLTERDHPLTARVFVNRIWRYHFGEGLVRSIEDFGIQGERPTHPELLDWLAVNFIERGWDIKWLNKTIMMSATYRQSSAEDPAKLASDPSNRLLWRKSPLRLEAEVIRDSMLQVSGLLDREMYGKQEPLRRSSDGQWVEDGGKGRANRRSIYLSSARTRPQGFLRAFDCPDMTSDSQAERFRSALPTQSLALLNNPLMGHVSKAFTDRLLEKTSGNIEAALPLAFELAYSRPPSEEELAFARAMLANPADGKRAFRLFVQGLLAANDFLYAF